MKEKAIVLISGGIDSAVVTALASKQNYDIYMITVNYGQKNWKTEYKNSTFFAKHYNAIEHKVFDMKWLGELGKNGITDSKVKFDGVNKDLEYVPFRNTCMISAAIAMAEVKGINKIFTGSMAGPWICPDNSPEYYVALQNLVNIATKLNKNIKVEAPLNHMDKPQIIQKAIELNVPLEKTFTCVGRSKKACGKCPPCMNRLQSFETLGMKDVVKYQIKE